MSQQSGGLIQELRERATESAGVAHALPFAAYSDPDVFDLELDRIFQREWIGVCPSAALPEPGDYLAFDIGHEPVIVIRGPDGVLRAVSNVCRHRGAPLLDPGKGNALKIVCPYHAWGFDATGELGAVPYPGDVEIDQKEHCLPRFQLEEWAGAVFVNLEPDAEPLSERLSGIDRYVESFALERFTGGAISDPLVWDSNWKLVFENGIESYHLFKVHAPTLEPVSPTKDAYYVDGSAPWTVTAGRLTMGTKVRESDSPSIGAFERENYVLISIPPSFVGIMTRDTWGWISVLPIAADKTLIYGGATLLPGAARGGISNDFYYQFMEEDRLICERSQRAMRARRTQGGRLVELERIIVDFHQYVAEKLFDTKPDARWISPQAVEIFGRPG